MWFQCLHKGGRIYPHEEVRLRGNCERWFGEVIFPTNSQIPGKVRSEVSEKEDQSSAHMKIVNSYRDITQCATVDDHRLSLVVESR